VVEPGPVACCEKSGSASHNTENGGTPSAQKPSSNARAVQGVTIDFGLVDRGKRTERSGDFGEGGRRQRAAFREQPRRRVVRPLLAVEQERDGFRAGDRGALRRVLRPQDLGERGDMQITIVAHRIALADGLQIIDPHRFQTIDGRAILLVRHHAARSRVNAGGQGGSIDLGRADKDRVMILKKHPLPGESIERGRVLLGNEIGPHAIPDHHHDLPGVGGGVSSKRKKNSREQEEETEK